MPSHTRPKIKVSRAELQEILPFRKQFLQENNFQIRYDACHARRWSDPYVLSVDGQPVGYGAVKGLRELHDRDAAFEYYLIPPVRKWESPIFAEWLRVCGATFVECQSNDLLITARLFECCRSISSDVVLFADHVGTDRSCPGVVFRRRRPGDEVFGKIGEATDDYVLERAGQIIAAGGFLTHYNPPFADLYMEVHPDFRNQGLASFILQEVKRECYRAGRVPAARCNITNKASWAALIKAGLRVCGFMLQGKVQHEALEK